MTNSGHWLDQYAGTGFAWHEAQHDGCLSFYRAMGLVERSFDADGRHYEGRADMSIQLDVTLRLTLGQAEIRHHTLLAWTCLRARHVLLRASSKAPSQLRPASSSEQNQRYFRIDVPSTKEEAIDEAKSQLIFLEDHYSAVDPLSFYNLSENCARLVDSERSLGKIYVLPQSQNDRLSYILVVAHQIGDGIAMGGWITDFLRLLNMQDNAIEAELTTAITPESLRQRLPPPQEALYPPITGSKARQRWFWLLTRILRHVRTPLPVGFSNPLSREKPLPAMPPENLAWNKVLDYSRLPPNNSATCRVRWGTISTQKLTKICRSANVSIGAGCFALAALLMMEFYERREPDVPLHLRKPFITGFPINPRPFLQGNPAANSLMLAFSDGILLPFLPSSVDLEGRLRLLAKQAQRQLAVYQKRVAPGAQQVSIKDMTSRGAGRVLAIQYIGSIERCAALEPDQSQYDPQGAYPMRPNMTRQTCGVSSAGRSRPLASITKYENAAYVATPIGISAGVRAREGEFLIGVGTGDSGLNADVSIDTSTMDPDLVAEWQHRFETILEEDDDDDASAVSSKL